MHPQYRMAHHYLTWIGLWLVDTQDEAEMQMQQQRDSTTQLVQITTRFTPLRCCCDDEVVYDSICNAGTMKSVTQEHMIGAHLLENACAVCCPLGHTSHSTQRSSEYYSSLPGEPLNYHTQETDRSADMARFFPILPIGLARPRLGNTGEYEAMFSANAGLSVLYHVESGRREMRGSCCKDWFVVGR